MRNGDITAYLSLLRLQTLSPHFSDPMTSVSELNSN